MQSEDGMALLENGHTTPTRPGIEAGELEAGLTKLMPFLRSFARSVAGNRELAEDLAQEALAKVWRSRSSFTPGSNLKAWVFTILRNEFISHKRRAWRQAPWESEWAETIPAASDEQDRAIELSDAVRALHGLPQAQRQALMLVGLGGFAYDDAAVLASCRVGTMKSRVARARKALRDMLESRRPLPAESRPANGNAIDELFAELTLASKQPS
jgi:RNA polymerase sigma-70 factor (ECF subfamily)